mmetsp:Transcript_15601/g.38485  ORF Transcript_15601/g.38485 Transcript_15601/m.38485 type:complete len:98 (-) Transcript_15601:1333-1626(-)
MCSFKDRGSKIAVAGRGGSCLGLMLIIVALPVGVQAAQRTRYLLYDAKLGEGFNLQKEIFIRAAWLAEALNSECASEDCPRWIVVLPPWCFLAHWRV